MDFDRETMKAGPLVRPVPPSAPTAAPPVPLPDRRTVPLNPTSPSPPRKKKRQLTTDQIVAIVILVLLLAGVICVTLALTGVFNRTPPGISLTPSVSLSDRVPNPLPSIVYVG